MVNKIKLDVGCGDDPKEGYVGIDMRECAAIQHDLCVFPWPLEDNSCSAIRMHLVWGCIEPKYRLLLMDEIWRIAAVDCMFDLVETHSLSSLCLHDPLYYSGANEYTFLYFYPESDKYKVYRPKPWTITKYYSNFSTVINVQMYPIKEPKNDTSV